MGFLRHYMPPEQSVFVPSAKEALRGKCRDFVNLYNFKHSARTLNAEHILNSGSLSSPNNLLRQTAGVSIASQCAPDRRSRFIYGQHVPLPGMTQRAPAGRLWAAQDPTSRPLRLPDPPVRSTSAIMNPLFG